MKPLSEDERALVASLVAALRRRGWPAGRALALAAGHVPSGPLREQLAAVASALGRGELAPATEEEPLLALLGRGDAAGPEALDEAVKGLLAAAAARRARWASVFPPLLILLSGVALLAAGGWLLAWLEPYQFLGVEAGLPWMTEQTLRLLEAMRWAGPFLFVAIALGAGRWARRRSPGTRSLQAAALLRQYVAACRAGLDEAAALALVDPSAPPTVFASSVLGLDPLARALGERWMKREGTAAAARRVAEELELEGRREARAFQAWAPLAAVVFWLAVGAPLLFALYLPIFSIGGAIQ